MAICPIRVCPSESGLLTQYSRYLALMGDSMYFLPLIGLKPPDAQVLKWHSI